MSYFNRNIFDKISDWICSTKFNEPESINIIKSKEDWLTRDECKKKAHPIWFFIDETIIYNLDVYLIDKPRSFYYFLRNYFVPSYRCDVVKSQTIKRGSYSDITYRLPESMFILLESFYENEFDQNKWYLDDDDDPDDKHIIDYCKKVAPTARKIKRAYWYKKNVWDKQDELEEKYINMKRLPNNEEYWKFEAWKQRNDERILKYIVEVHGSLWS